MIDNILKWTALCCVLSGATCTSLQLDPLNIYLLNGGALLYLLWSIRQRDLNLVMVNGGLLAIYLVGFFRR